MRRVTISGLSWLALAGLAAACGGGGSDGDKATTHAATQASPTVGSPPSAAKKKFIKQADRVCAAGRKRLTPIAARAEKAAQSGDPAVVYRRYAVLTARAATIYGSIGGQLRDLGPPPADQAEIDRLASLLDQTAGIERQISAAAAQQDGPRLKQLALEVNGVVDRFRAGAKAYGFHECASTAGAAVNRRGNR